MILLAFLNALKTPEIFVDLFLIQMGKICVVLVRSSPAWVGSATHFQFLLGARVQPASLSLKAGIWLQEIQSRLNKYNNFLSRGHFNILNGRNK